MQKPSRIAEISTKVAGGGAAFYVHPVYEVVTVNQLIGMPHP